MRWTATAFFLSALFFGVSSAAYSQAMDGNLVGTITDQSGAAVPNAALEIEKYRDWRKAYLSHK